MSRPFSYSDECFTVIGNILFVHIMRDGSCFDGMVLRSVPPEIVKRLYTKNNCLFSTLEFNDKSHIPVVIDGNNLITKGKVPVNPDYPNTHRWFYGWYHLKDI